MEIILPEHSELEESLHDSSPSVTHKDNSDASLEGEGQGPASPLSSDQTWTPNDNATADYAPRKPPMLRSRMRAGSLAKLRSRIPHSRTISGAHHAWTRATVGGGLRENARFLDHFRYVMVASQLLEETFDHASFKSAQAKQPTFDKGATLPSSLALISYKGAAVAAIIAFLAVWVVQLASNSSSRTISVILILCYLAFSGAIIYLHGRRQMVRYVHLQVLQNASSLVRDLQSFELASASALSLIQEVEVVAKGYKSGFLHSAVGSSGGTAMRRCMSLRRSLGRSYIAMSGSLSAAIAALKPYNKANDYDKFLDVYDIPREALEQALDVQHVENTDIEAIGSLRVFCHRTATLRRALLCSLLSLDTDEDVMDYQQWRTVADLQDQTSRASASNASTLLQALEELEDLALPVTPVKTSGVANERIKSQVRKIANLSSSIKTLQAKMALLREESNAAISQAEDLSDLGPTLMTQYQSIGADIDTLRQAWESGKATLSANIIEQEKRLSLSPSLASPSTFTPLGGLPSVHEGGPAEALLALNGERGLSALNPSMSPASSMPATPSDEEVFEATALPMPKQRSSLSREERIRLMREERERADERKARRESGLNMMRELKTVINLRRNPDLPPGARVTSI